MQSSSLRENFWVGKICHDEILDVIYDGLKMYHMGFLRSRGKDWQSRMALQWKVKHLITQDYSKFVERILSINDMNATRHKIIN